MPKKPLTEEQKGFLDKFIRGKSRTAKRSVENAYVDYLRRRDKVLAETAKLVPGSPGRTLLEAEVKGANDLADGGQFKQAYARLEDVKASAKLAGKQAVDALPGIDFDGRLDALELDLTGARDDVQSLIGRAEQLLADMADDEDLNETPETADDLEPIYEVRASYQVRMAGLVEEADRLEVKVGLLKVPVRMQVLAHQISLLEKTKGGTAKAGPLRSRLIQIDQDYRLQGHHPWDMKLPMLMASIKQECDDKLKLQLATLGQDQGLLAEIRNAKRTPPDLSKLEQAETERLGKAKQLYLDAIKQDAVLNPPDPKNPLEKRTAPHPVELRAFDVENVLPEGFDGSDLTEETVSDVALKGGEALAKLLLEEPPTSDIVFDLMLKNKAAFVGELAKNLGWDVDPKQRSEAQNGALDRIGGTLYQKVLDACPNKMSQDGATIMIGGKPYTRGEKLGEGGLGEIWRYTDEEGNKIVVKSLKGDNAVKRPEMITELQMHRRAMGGEKGKGHPNVVPMEGTAIGEDGSLHMMMKEAEGGDVNRFARSLQAVSDSGVLPPEARAVLVRYNFTQAVRGMKYVHDCNLAHNDIKSANYLMGSDGTMQVADFGSTRETDDEGNLLTVDDKSERSGKRLKEGKPATTIPLAPMEGGGVGSSTKSDVFLLGSMLDVMTRDTHHDHVGPGIQSWYYMGSYKTGHGMTSLDRLRNQMLDDDPKKRPSLESVLLSSYLDEDGGPNEEDVKALNKAVVAYAMKVGKRVEAEQEKISKSLAKIRVKRLALEEARKELVTATDTIADHPGKIQRTEEAIEDLQQEIQDFRLSDTAEEPTEYQRSKMQELDELQKQLPVLRRALSTAQRKDLDALRKTVETRLGELNEVTRIEEAAQMQARAEIETINQEEGVPELLDAIRIASQKIAPLSAPKSTEPRERAA